jgi:hypothetical protein
MGAERHMNICRSRLQICIEHIPILMRRPDSAKGRIGPGTSLSGHQSA